MKTEKQQGFIERFVNHKSVYQAFYGSFWWRKKVFGIYHIGCICLKYIGWKNSRKAE